MRFATIAQRNKDSCVRMLVAVAAASLDTTSLSPPNAANPPSSTVINQKTPAILALKSGPLNSSFVIFRLLDRSAIAPQPDRCRNECRGEQQSDPETWRAQISSRSKLCQRVNREIALRIVRVKSERLCRPTHQAVFNEGGEVRSPERNPLEDTNREQR